ncbi:hypothetical protein Lal_00006486 [Lupinus albus]|nr:hypothetical protein Lal_00006486 [Lupinus albus]
MSCLKESIEDNVMTYCGLCGEEDEAINHLFFTCSKSYHICQHIYSRFGLSSIIFNDVKIKKKRLIGRKVKTWIGTL